MLLPKAFNFVATLFFACLVCGCSADPSKTTEQANEETNAVLLTDMKVLVVGDDSIGQVIARQWSARRDAKIEVVSASEAEMASRNFELDGDIDVVIYPSRMLGGFVEADQLEQVPAVVWDDSEQLNRKELLRHPRTTNIRFGNKNWAVPLGEPQFALIFRKDVLKQLGENPPTNWEEFDALAKRLRESPDLKNENGEPLPTKISLPMTDYWRTQMLMVRVAPYVRARGRITTLFNRDTMAPLVANPAFVRALSELKAIGESDAERLLECDPQTAYRDVTEGRSAMAITWPSVAFDSPDMKPELADQIGIARVPGSQMLFDQSAGSWNERESDDNGYVALVGFQGLVASISRKSSNLLTTYEFLKWLPSKQISNSVLTKSPFSGPFRASHLGNPMQWTGDGISPDASEDYANLVSAINDETVIVVFPRISGRARYVASLDKAVADALTEAATPSEALNQAVVEFDKITQEIGVRAQANSLKESKEY